MFTGYCSGKLQRITGSERLCGSFTVEAALVMPVVLIAMAISIRYGLILHDEAIGNAALNEAIEIYGHFNRSYGGDGELYAEEAASMRLSSMLSQKSMGADIEESGDGCTGSITGVNYEKTITDNGFKPEQTMRRITLLDAVDD